jgi:hypothetical protein
LRSLSWLRRRNSSRSGDVGFSLHVWQLFAAVLPEAQQAIEHIGAFIRKHLT